jgi:hypothetical protein
MILGHVEPKWKFDESMTHFWFQIALNLFFICFVQLKQMWNAYETCFVLIIPLLSHPSPNCKEIEMCWIPLLQIKSYHQSHLTNLKVCYFALLKKSFVLIILKLSHPNLCYEFESWQMLKKWLRNFVNY